MASNLLLEQPVGSLYMRLGLLLAAVLACPSLAFSKTKAVDLCDVEKRMVESTNNQIVDSTTLTLELRTFLISERENREGRLKDRLQQAETRMQQANQTLLLETELLQTLVAARPNLDRLAAALPRLMAFETLPPRPSSAAAIDDILKMQINALDSEAVADLKVLIQTVRLLEKSSRNWRTLVGNEPPQGLSEVLNRVLQSHSALNETVMNGPSVLARAKQEAAAAQTAIATSLLERREREEQLAELERRLVLLRQNLPVQKAALHACTRRSQFGG